MSERDQLEGGVQRPKLEAWRVSTADGEAKRVIVGRFWNDPERIEIDPDDLVSDPDAYREES